MLLQTRCRYGRFQECRLFTIWSMVAIKVASGFGCFVRFPDVAEHCVFSVLRTSLGRTVEIDFRYRQSI